MGKELKEVVNKIEEAMIRKGCVGDKVATLLDNFEIEPKNKKRKIY